MAQEARGTVGRVRLCSFYALTESARQPLTEAILFNFSALPTRHRAGKERKKPVENTKQKKDKRTERKTEVCTQVMQELLLESGNVAGAGAGAGADSRRRRL